MGNEKANVLCVSMVRSTLSIGLTIMNNDFCFVFVFSIGRVFVSFSMATIRYSRLQLLVGS